ncbi:MAG: NUDIX hydrolase [Candidatus Stahlbacteria bacterium]|nr:NUDIX hydrolase [Candidatus Stahlbacteria bacterium]
MPKYPRLTVDIIIKCCSETEIPLVPFRRWLRRDSGIILIERKNPPFGWAIPGGFVEYGEQVEETAFREAKEETSLEVKNLKQFYVYSKPSRDPRGHTISVVFTAEAEGTPKADSDAKNIGIFTKDNLPHNIAFDHREILDNYFSSKE